MLLAKLRCADQLNFSRLITDRSSVRAPAGKWKNYLISSLRCLVRVDGRREVAYDCPATSMDAATMLESPARPLLPGKNVHFGIVHRLTHLERINWFDALEF